MQLDEFARQRETQSGAFLLVRVAASDLTELLEYRLLVLGGDADSRVMNGDDEPVDRAAGADPDLTAVRCELYRVRQQVEQDLLELALVCKDLAELRIGVEAERDAVPLCTLAYQRHRIGDRHRH